jgi:glutathione S-transferase
MASCASPYRLYGSELSYFTSKVRAYLRWAVLSFEEIFSDAEVYRQIIVPGVEVAVIPVVRTPEGTLLQHSTEIIETLDARHARHDGVPSVHPAGPVQRLVSLMLETYGDERLVIPAMHYRWHHNRDWAVAQFVRDQCAALDTGSPRQRSGTGRYGSA